MFSRIVSAISFGLIVGISLVWTSALLFPVIPIVIPTLSIGSVLSGFYLYRSLKKEFKTITREIDAIHDLHDLKENLLRKYPHKSGSIVLDLYKDNQLLLKEVLTTYTDCLKDKADSQIGKYPRQEKIFKLIESLIGHTRKTDTQGKVLAVGDDLFYNQLASYLKSDHCTLEEANKITERFKNLFIGREGNEGLTRAPVNANDKRAIQKTLLDKSMAFLEQNYITILSVIGIGALVPLFLAGPQFILLGTVAAIVLSGFLISSVTSQNAANSQKQRESDKAKLHMINHICKLDKLSPSPKLTFPKFPSENFSNSNSGDSPRRNLPAGDIELAEFSSNSLLRSRSSYPTTQTLGSSLSSIWQEELPDLDLQIQSLSKSTNGLVL